MQSLTCLPPPIFHFQLLPPPPPAPANLMLAACLSFLLPPLLYTCRRKGLEGFPSQPAIARSWLWAPAPPRWWALPPSARALPSALQRSLHDAPTPRPRWVLQRMCMYNYTCTCMWGSDWARYSGGLSCATLAEARIILSICFAHTLVLLQ